MENPKTRTSYEFHMWNDTPYFTGWTADYRCDCMGEAMRRLVTLARHCSLYEWLRCMWLNEWVKFVNVLEDYPEPPQDYILQILRIEYEYGYEREREVLLKESFGYLDMLKEFGSVEDAYAAVKTVAKAGKSFEAYNDSPDVAQFADYKRWYLG